MNQEMFAVHNQLMIRKEQILQEAFGLRNDFLLFKNSVNEDIEDRWKRSYMDLYVRRKEGIVEMAWRKHVYVPNSKKKFETIHIKKGTGYAYKKRELQKYMMLWEHDVILEVEDDASKLREEVDKINKVLKSIREDINLPKIELYDDLNTTFQQMKQHWKVPHEIDN